jgi:hypothetical protein
MLLNLAGEIRELIYEFFFSDQIHEILGRAEVAEIMQCASSQDQASQDLASRKIIKIPTNALALSLTCRQTYRETRPFPLHCSTFSTKDLWYLTQYYENTFSPAPWYGYMDLRYQRNIMRSIIHSMTSLEIYLPCADRIFSQIFVDDLNPVDIRSVRNIKCGHVDPDKVDILRYMTNLERIHVYGSVEFGDLPSVMKFLVAVQELQVFMPEVEVTGQLVYLEPNETKHSHFIRKPTEDNKIDLLKAAMRGLGWSKSYV